jgi:hypothetical protein
VLLELYLAALLAYRTRRALPAQILTEPARPVEWPAADDAGLYGEGS